MPWPARSNHAESTRAPIARNALAIVALIIAGVSGCEQPPPGPLLPPGPKAASAPSSSGSNPSPPAVRPESAKVTRPDLAPAVRRPRVAAELRRKAEAESHPLAGRAPAETEKVGVEIWNAKPDPPATKVAIDVPKNFRVPLQASVSAVFPGVPSQYVLLVSDQGLNEGCALLDLRRPTKPAGMIRNREFNGRAELVDVSPNGEILFDCDFFGAELRVWSFAGQMIERTFKAAGHTQVAKAQFLDAKRLVAVRSSFQSCEANVYDVTNGDTIQTISFSTDPIRGAVEPQNVAVSPGGNLLAIMPNTQVLIYDLNTGERLGAVRLSPNDAMSSAQSSHIAFHPDGSKLAIYWRLWQERRFACLDMKNGSIIFDRTTDSPGSIPSHGGGDSSLAWLADGETLLVNASEVVDAATGMALTTLSDPPTGKFLPINDGRLIVQRSVPAFGGEMSVMALPNEQIEQNRKLVRADLESGATATRVPDMSTVTARSMPTTPLPWTAKFAPVVPAAGLMPQPLSAGRRGTTVDRVIFAGTPPTLAALMFANANAPGGIDAIRPTKGAPPYENRLECFDLATGQRKGEIGLKGMHYLYSISDDGSLALIGKVPQGSRRGEEQAPNLCDKLEVWSFATGKVALAFRPYQHEPLPQQRRATWAAMLGKRSALTLNGQGKLVKWELPSCKAQYAIDDFGQAMALSPDGQHLVGWMPNTDVLRVVKTDTGECCGELHVGMRLHNVKAVAFSPDGLRLAAAVDGDYSMLAVWEMGEGRLLHEVPTFDALVADHKALLWVDPRYVLAGGRFLVDLERQAVAWQYTMPAGQFAAGTPDGRCWYAVPDSGEAACRLVALTLPSDATRQASAELELGDQVSFRPGVAISVNVAAPQRENAMEVVTARLAELDIAHDPNADLCLTCEVSEQSAGRSQLYRNRFTGETFEMPLKQLHYKYRLAYRDGVELWSTEGKSGVSPPGHVELATANQEYDKGVAGTTANHLSSIRLPRYLFHKPETLGAGHSQLGGAGEVPQ